MSDEKPLLVDRTTRASNPGRVQVNYLRWWRFFPRWPTIHTVASLIWFLLAVMLNNFLCVVLGLIALLLNVVYFVRVREHFRFGDANPGRVVSLNPTCIAVATNLRKGPGSYPVLKVVVIPLKESLNKPLQIGDSVPTVALYGGTPPESPRWSDFYPLPVECATRSRVQIEGVESSFSAKHWENLESALAQVTDRTPGLHLLFDEGVA